MASSIIAPDKPEILDWGESTEQTDSGNRPPLVRQGSLPQGVLFDADTNGTPINGGPKRDDADDASDTPVDSSAWVSKVVFLPTGEAQDDYTLPLRKANAQPIVLQLRASAGTAKTITTKENR